MSYGSDYPIHHLKKDLPNSIVHMHYFHSSLIYGLYLNLSYVVVRIDKKNVSPFSYENCNSSVRKAIPMTLSTLKHVSLGRVHNDDVVLINLFLL